MEAHRLELEGEAMIKLGEQVVQKEKELMAAADNIVKVSNARNVDASICQQEACEKNAAVSFVDE